MPFDYTFTAVANSLLDEWAPELSNHELRVLLLVLRQTEGWNQRPSASISLRQFRDYLRSNLSHVTQAIQGLQDKGLLQVHKHHNADGGYSTSTYSVVIPGRYHLVPQRDQGVIPVPRQGVIPERDQQKKVKKEDLRIWKETKEKLAQQMTPANYTTYFAPLELVSVGPKTMSISAPSQAVGDYVKRRCLPLIRKAVGKELEITVEVQIMRTDLGAITG